MKIGYKATYNYICRGCIFEIGKFTSNLYQECSTNDNILVEANKKLLPLEQIRINMMRQYGKF